MNISRIQKKSPPHIRSPRTAPLIMLDVIVALVPLYIMAYLYYGFRTVFLGVTGIVTCLISSWICSLISAKKINFYDLSPIVTGMLIPLLLPASIEYSIVICASLFAVVVVKYPFGGSGCNFFNPTAAAIAFAAFCWPSKIFSYTQPLEKLPLFENITATVQSPAYLIKSGALPNLDATDLLLGNFAGPMGAPYVLVLIACFLFLLFRRVVNLGSTLSFFAAAALMFTLFPRISSDNIPTLLIEFSSGSIVLGGIFLVNDPATSPKRNIPKFIYGFFIGIVTVLFRYYGGFEQGVMFAVLLANIFSPTLDILYEKLIYYVRRVRIVKETEISQ